MSIKRSIKNSFLLIAEKVILLGTAFLVSVLLARIGGPAIFGKYSYITSYTAVFAPFCVMGINNIAVNYFVKYPNNSHHYLVSTLLLRALGATLAVLIGILAITFYESPEDRISLITLLVLQVFSIFNIIEYYFLSLNNVITSSKIRLLVYISTGILKVLMIYQQVELYYIVLIHGLEFLFIAIGFTTRYIANNHHLKLKNVNYSKTAIALFHKGKWLFLSTIAAVIYLKIDQIMIEKMRTVEEVAYYAAAAKLSEFWYVFPILIANAFNTQLVTLRQKSSHEYTHLILTLLRGLIVLAILAILMTSLFAEQLIALIYGGSYPASAQILSIHILASLFIFQRAILSKWLIIEKYYRFSLTSQSAGAVTNIVLNLIFIPKYGAIAAAWTTLFSYFVASFLSLLLTKQSRVFLRLMILAMLTWPLIYREYSKRVKN